MATEAIDKSRRLLRQHRGTNHNVSIAEIRESKLQVRWLSREAKDKWWRQKAQQIQWLVDANQLREFYSEVRKLIGTTSIAKISNHGETQFGFHPERGTCETIFSVLQLQQKSREQARPLYLCFVDLEKDFHSVKSSGLYFIKLDVHRSLWDFLEYCTTTCSAAWLLMTNSPIFSSSPVR